MSVPKTGSNFFGGSTTKRKIKSIQTGIFRRQSFDFKIFIKKRIGCLDKKFDFRNIPVIERTAQWGKILDQKVPRAEPFPAKASLYPLCCFLSGPNIYENKCIKKMVFLMVVERGLLFFFFSSRFLKYRSINSYYSNDTYEINKNFYQVSITQKKIKYTHFSHLSSSDFLLCFLIFFIFVLSFNCSLFFY